MINEKIWLTVVYKVTFDGLLPIIIELILLDIYEYEGVKVSFKLELD